MHEVILPDSALASSQERSSRPGGSDRQVRPVIPAPPSIPLLRVMNGKKFLRSLGRSGFSILEIAVLLVLAAALVPPLLGSAFWLRNAFHLRQAQEKAARLVAEARWTAVGTGGAVVEFTVHPPTGWVISATGDTVTVSRLDEGDVFLHLSRNRTRSRIRFGPLGLGKVSSQTLRFTLGGQERALVISSLGRVSRR